MKIRITGTLDGTRTEPEKAEVAVGEHVSWSIEVRGRTPSVGWEIYFENDSPFRRRSYRVATTMRVSQTYPPSDEAAIHVGEVDAGTAEEPGEYKYGVRASDDSTGRILSDDDPYIIVRRRSR